MKLRFAAAIGAALLYLIFESALAQAADGEKKPSEDISKKIQAGSFTPRIFERNEYRANQDGSYANFFVSLIELPVGETMAFRLEVPIVTRIPHKPGADTDTGLGDINARISKTALAGDGYAVVLGLEYGFDSASEDSLGSGKQILSPLIYGSVKVPSLKSVLFPLVQYYQSIGGNSARADVKYTVVKPIVLTRLPDHFYTLAEPAIYIDHERNDRVGANLEFEVGRFVNSQTMVYGRPGVGLFGDDMSQIMNWNFEVGFRYFFR